MAWWLWAILGIALLILEVHTFGGFYLMFFGVGGLLVAGLVAVGLESTSAEWLLFTGLSVATLLMFRPPLVRKMASGASGDPVDNLVGEAAVVENDVPAEGVGKAELRGTTWSVRSDGAVAIAKGTRCRVARVDGLTLWIRPE